MGWTESPARHFRDDWSVDVRAECDDLYTWEDGHARTEVLRSSMVGSTYYAAVRTTSKETGASEVWGAVCLTERPVDRYDFAYKMLDETVGPVEADCPRAILDLLTPTSNRSALDWRARCLESASRRSYSRAVTRLPLGTRLSWVAPAHLSHYREGETVELTLVKVAGRRALVDLERGLRVPARLVGPDNSRLVGTVGQNPPISDAPVRGRPAASTPEPSRGGQGPTR